MTDAPQAEMRKAEWIVLAVQLLRREGPAALTVERLCDRVKRDAAAFNMHFKGIGSLALELAEHWANAEARIVSQAAQSEGPPMQRLMAVLSLSGVSDPALDRGVRALAADYAEIAEIVRIADDRREMMVSAMLAEVYGIKGDEARAFGRLFNALHLAAMTRPEGEGAAYAEAPAKALTAMLGSNFPID
ncbi:MAG: hypothetical protein KF780_10115 [Sphingomonas sp.]|nr:hypothetical protein [Sphingomonas sp.]